MTGLCIYFVLIIILYTLHVRFTAACMDQDLLLNTETRLRAAFAFFDRNGDGTVEPGEVAMSIYKAISGESPTHSTAPPPPPPPPEEGGGAAPGATVGKSESRSDVVLPDAVVPTTPRRGSVDPVQLLQQVKGALQMMAEADTNGDGVLSYDEFVDWLKRPRSPTTTTTTTPPQRSTAGAAVVTRVSPVLSSNQEVRVCVCV